METNEISEKEVLIKLGERIVHLRKESGLKQIEFAIILGIEDSALRRIESGRTNPTTKTLFRIAKELNTNVKDLFDF